MPHEPSDKSPGKAPSLPQERLSTPGLRETLAKRLNEAWWDSTLTPAGKNIFGISPGFYRQADECTRQMEWARYKHGWSSCPFCGGPPHPELTLAPEDWKP